MTLTELLSAQVVAGVVLAAAGALVILSLRSEQRVSDKVNSASQGRIISAQIEQRLNSQLCLYPGEYQLNGATVGTAAASIVHAGENQVIYFADISVRASGATTGVGFEPYMRYLQAPTAGTGRSGSFIDAYRPPSTSVIPFNYSISPATTLSALASSSMANSVPPTSILRRLGSGVTNAVTGTTSSPVPFLQYWNTDNLGPTSSPITLVGGAVPADQIDSIGRIRVNFRVLANSGFDTAKGAIGPTALDDRTETFASDIYLRTTPDICDQLGT